MSKDIEAREKVAKVARSIADYWASPWRTPQTSQQVDNWRKGLAADTKRMAGTIDDLLAQLRARDKKLEAVEVAAHSGQYVWRAELDRILGGSE